tara:strand:+ start:992 stop:1552 length:561 start_codon:yes stop_codon:yes gene_type:complete
MKKNKIFFKNYITEFSQVIDFNNQIIDQIIKIKTILQKKSKNNKVLIFGNGGSAAISSHVSVDLTKNAGIKCINFNESDLITCFSNDYGYENWINKAVEFYSRKGDILILVSVSGTSPNVVKAAKLAKKHGIKTIITLTGSKNKNNSLKKNGDINIWINSKSYNMVENAHQLILLMITDAIIKERK